ncbi:MAG: hypothetical protein H6969_09165 [Gammaproteobacteria bacterium]|nr:hypothetical protein [Gammaproteobacteria bacterium]
MDDFIALKNPMLIGVWTRRPEFSNANQILVATPRKYRTRHWVAEIL